ncbi:MAG TPA: class A beta-lactamase [Pseudonocardiaceae bacterium]|nr:class A beta-lactamase [Pseudonocardiaceae bacterium]
MRPYRVALALTGCLLLAGCTGTVGTTSTSSSPVSTTTTVASDPAFARLEQQFGARLGVYVLDTGTGNTVSYRADERFAYDSTMKILIAGTLLRRDSDADLDKVITYTQADLQSYSPITAPHVGTGLTVRELLPAALQYSDNTAANLLLAQLGGPAGLQSAMRALGDTTSHIDRNEPSLNDAVPGDIRDTSTPRAIGTDLRQFALGGWLSGARQQQLVSWLQGNTTGGPYIRAGVPAGWKVGDKTGNGDYGTRNDIAIAWPPSGSPVLIAIDTARNTDNATSNDALIADATKAALADLH